MTCSNLLDTIEVDLYGQTHALDLSASADHLALYHRSSVLADHVRALFFQQDHVAWSCPPVDHAPIPFFLANHAQECAHAVRARDVAFHMIGCLNHCIRDNHMPMAERTPPMILLASLLFFSMLPPFTITLKLVQQHLRRYTSTWCR